jgi:hypothetical protein
LSIPKLGEARRDMTVNLRWVVLCLPLVVAACAPNVNPDQVAVRFYPPPWKNPAMQQMEDGACQRGASGYVKLYVECMQARGYRPEIVGQGGVAMTLAQLPEPPAGVRAPMQTPMSPSTQQYPAQRAAPVNSSCESQVNDCHACPNGRASNHPESGGCFYENVASCRATVIRTCRASPAGSDDGLNVRGGKLTNAQVEELMNSCRNIPHGLLPYTGSAAPPGSKKAQQCEAFYNTYFTCNMLFRGFDPHVTETRGKCLRETYSGP